MSGPAPDGGDPYADRVGSLAEEAARLAEAVGAWARGHAAEQPPPAHHGPECRLCPLCQAFAVLRGARPETLAHLLDAGAALAAAVRSALEGPAAPPPAGRTPSVQHIDVG